MVYQDGNYLYLGQYSQTTRQSQIVMIGAETLTWQLTHYIQLKLVLVRS